MGRRASGEGIGRAGNHLGFVCFRPVRSAWACDRCLAGLSCRMRTGLVERVSRCRATASGSAVSAAIRPSSARPSWWTANPSPSCAGTLLATWSVHPGRHVSVLDLRARVSKGDYALDSYRPPHDVRVSSDGSVFWVACAPARTVLEVSAPSGRILRAWDIALDGGWFVGATPDDRKLYVPHLEGKSLTVIDRQRNSEDRV
jgi:hypothetical protein